MSTNYLTQLENSGFAHLPQAVDNDEIEYLISCLSKLKISSAVCQKKNSTYGVRNLLNLAPGVRKFAESSKVRKLVESILNKDAKPVRVIFFDKTPEANWKVPWHQDLTIAVKEKRETENFSAWTRKADILHVQPPTKILRNILTLRFHLDDANETNGALKVVPNSHKHGRLSATKIQNLRQANGMMICSVKRGDAILMRPLLVHSSSSGTSPKHRRVIHLEFSAENLPNGLEWYGS
jgi:ectoine hydroxylase-related dioxygenase (phytanoyl-CoA dioxygenase family)